MTEPIIEPGPDSGPDTAADPVADAVSETPSEYNVIPLPKAAPKPGKGNSADVRSIKVNALARVEGEGALQVKIKDGKVASLAFRIYEPPRFIEALLRGRMFWDAPDITSRICGICPLAYITSACNAMEDALDVSVPQTLKDLRRLAYCGEWIESHVLHAAMLHAPDFLGCHDVFELGQQVPDVVRTALKLKKLGNEMIEVVGGRAIHPVSFKVGGFYRAPSVAAVRALIDPLVWAIEAAETLGRAFAGFTFPEFEQPYRFVSLRHERDYPICEGRIVSSEGLDIPVQHFSKHFREEHVAWSTALHGMTMAGETYTVGPLARFANNRDRLTPRAAALTDEIGLGPVVRNPFKSILVRMVETVLACEEALRICRSYELPERSDVPITAKAGTGHGISEAPRGICYHTYTLDGDGRITQAVVVPPTSQNQRQIEADLKGVVEANLALADDDLRARCEFAVRNYDPCISCATHILDLRIQRS